MDPDVSVKEVMDQEYLGVSESDDVLATVELFLRDGVDTAVVLRGSEAVGVLTTRDILSLLVDGPPPAEATVREAMTEAVPTVSPGTSIAAAAEELSTRNARRVVVSDGDGEPLGVLTEHDVLAMRPYPATDRTGGARPGEPAGIEAGTAVVTPDAEFQDQGICEMCGTLTTDLAGFNGQLACADCRDV